METRQERIDEQISIVNNYGSDMSGFDSELRYCEPDQRPAEKASSFSYEYIKFQELDSVKEAIEKIRGFQEELNGMKEEYEQAVQLVDNGADQLEEILDALWAIQEILEEEVEIEVGQVVFQTEYHTTFRVLAVSSGVGNTNYAWCRDVNNPYSEPVTFQWTQLEIKEEAKAS